MIGGGRGGEGGGVDETDKITPNCFGNSVLCACVFVCVFMCVCVCVYMHCSLLSSMHQSTTGVGHIINQNGCPVLHITNKNHTGNFIGLLPLQTSVVEG